MLSHVRTVLIVMSAAVGLACMVAAPAQATETFGKWRVELKIGGISPGDEIRSDAANRMSVEAADGSTFGVSDPRPDEAALLSGRLATDPRIDARLSYGVARFKNSELIIGVSAGFWKSRINNLELTYALDIEDRDLYLDNGSGPYRGGTCETFEYVQGSAPIGCRDFSDGDQGLEEWHWRPINAGELTQVPVAFDATLRFRPTKKFNPYIGGALGWLFVEFDASEEWVAFSDQIDASVVDYARYDTDFSASALSGARKLFGNPHDVARPRVQADDGAYLELRGGFEWQWKPRIAIFLETSFMWAAEEIVITVDGREKFGSPTPDISVQDRSDDAVPIGGFPAYVICGGLTGDQIDSDINVPSSAVCPGAGEYFFNGGRLDHGGFSFQAGIRFTL